MKNRLFESFEYSSRRIFPFNDQRQSEKEEQANSYLGPFEPVAPLHSPVWIMKHHDLVVSHGKQPTPILGLLCSKDPPRS